VTVELLAIPAIALVAVVLMILSGRNRDDQVEGSFGADVENRADAVDGDGIHLDGRITPWPSIYEVVVVTRPSMRGTWFGLEVRADNGPPVLIDGTDGLVEPFLAESYLLPGFDHAAVADALASKRGRRVCFRR
jgi:hypothetical protein